MNIADYKVKTLARADVDDIIRFEPVEMKPNIDKTGYEPVVQVTEGGQTILKLDVHLMRVVDGVKVFDKEQIAVIDEGKPTEEVVFRSPSTEKEERVTSKLEKYINGLPYLNTSDMVIDGKAKNARFTALKDNGDGTASEVEVYAYILTVKNAPNEERHVEIIK